jgi:very-short-patch-repair endonuclease
MKERYKRLIKNTARSLRKNQTSCEQLLWEIIRGRKLAGKKFLRQYPIVFDWQGRKRFFVVDFYCHESKLAIELDGGVHEKQKGHDQLREKILKSLGIEVLRFDNDDIRNGLVVVMGKIKEKLLASAPSLHKRGGMGGEF